MDESKPDGTGDHAPDDPIAAAALEILAIVAEGLPRHALVAERHTGTGLSLKQIIEQNLPVPHRDMRPVSIEEQIICFADKFFSKTHLGEERDFEQARRKLEKFGEESLNQFDKWGKMFL